MILKLIAAAEPKEPLSQYSLTLSNRYLEHPDILGGCVRFSPRQLG
jgi:hypothetical protein